MIPGERTFRGILARRLADWAAGCERRGSDLWARRTLDLALACELGELIHDEPVVMEAWAASLQDAFGSLAEVDRMDAAMCAAVLVDEEGVARG